MRVLLVSREYPFGFNPRFGGGGSHVFYLALALAQLRVHVVVLAYDGAMKEKSPFAGNPFIEVVPADFGYTDDIAPGDAVEAALRICRDFRPDVVHGHHLQGSFVALAAGAACGIPVVVTLHKPPRLSRDEYSASAPRFHRDRFYSLWRLLATDRRIGAHVAYSQIYEVENRYLGVPRQKLFRIMHGVPVRLLRRAVRRPRLLARWGISPGHTVLVCPMRPEKPGVDIFLEAARVLLDNPRCQSRHLRFVVTGKPRSATERGRERATANSRLAQSRGLTSDLVLFENFTLRQMWSLLHRAQVCVLPSYREGLSIVLLEAMALGTPIVATEVSGINEAIEDGSSGCLVDPGKPDSLAECIVKVLTTPQLAARLRAGGRRRAQELFEARRMATEHLGMYRKLSGQ